jgi:hypothetical protein
MIVAIFVPVPDLQQTRCSFFLQSRVPKFTTPLCQSCTGQIAFASQEPRPRRVLAEGAAVGDSANVLRPAGSPFILLRHPQHRPRQRASVVCTGRTPALGEESGWRSAQRIGVDRNTNVQIERQIQTHCRHSDFQTAVIQNGMNRPLRTRTVGGVVALIRVQLGLV